MPNDARINAAQYFLAVALSKPGDKTKCLIYQLLKFTQLFYYPFQSIRQNEEQVSKSDEDLLSSRILLDLTHKVCEISTKEDLIRVIGMVREGRTSPNGRHYCKLHEKVVNKQHLAECDLIKTRFPLKEYHELLEKVPLDQLDNQQLTRVIEHYASIASQITAAEQKYYILQ